jgi:hypothetical protein
MSGSFFTQQLEILLKEWDFVDRNIARFDTIAFAVRGWAIALTTAVIGYSFSKEKPDFLLLAIAPILLLWALDALFKSFQRNFVFRSIEIENYLSSEQFQIDFGEDTQINSLVVPNTAGKFGQGTVRERTRKILDEMFVRNTVFSYSSQLILLILSWVYLCSKISI